MHISTEFINDRQLRIDTHNAFRALVFCTKRGCGQHFTRDENNGAFTAGAAATLRKNGAKR